jgi:hypothetical protein
MYIYLENSFFIPLSEIISIVDLKEFKKSEKGISFLEFNKAKLIDISKDGKNSLVITDKYLYISSYMPRSLNSRGNEFENLKKIGRENLSKYTTEVSDE